MSKFYAEGTNQVKKTIVMLKMMKRMLEFDYDVNRILRNSIEFENELFAIYKKSEGMKRCFAALNHINRSDYTSNFSGAEGCFCDGWFRPLTMLLNKQTFDLNRINEIIDLFETLRELSVFGVYISDQLTFNEMKDCFCSKIVSDSTINFSENKNKQEYTIFKVFSDAEIKYSEKQEVREGRFDCDFVTLPKWVLYGNAIYNQNQELYLGCSSPHTQFDFTSTSLYIDPATLPSRDELYSSHETRTLNVYKKTLKKVY